MDNQKTCIVTGGAGFIGSNLCDELLKLKYRVYCIDSLITGVETNIANASNNPDFTFIKWDVTKSLPVLGKIDFIYHLASPASVIDYQKYPKETALVNSVGTFNLLEIAKIYEAKFLYTSTSEIYGDPKVHPQVESYWGNVNPNGVRSCYDESKRFGEMATMLYHRLYNTDVRIIRIFNTYGPRMKKDDGRIISNFINQALENKPLTIYGNGNQTRSFCYVSDLIDGLIKAMYQDKTKGEVFNLGNPEEFRVIDVAKKIIKLTKSKSIFNFQNLPQDDPCLRKPDINKAKKILNWIPQINTDHGLNLTIDYYRQK
jgi:nucleoside-diphosphate-sugar epimerase